MKKFTYYFLTFGIAFFLTACSEPVVFNIPESTWNCMTTLQQQQAIENYNQEKINDPNKCCLREDPLKKCRCIKRYNRYS